MTSPAHANDVSVSDDASLRVVGALLLGAAALSPLHLPGWEYFAPRLLPLGVCALLLTLPLERLAPPRRRLAELALCAWALAAAAWPIAQQRALAARSAEALAGLDAPLALDGPRLPILFGDGRTGSPLAPDPRIPYALPLANLGHLYALAQGGLVPHNFAVNPALHHVLYRPEWQQRYPAVPPDLDAWIGAGSTPDPMLRAALATHAAGYGSVYQDVILWGRPEDAALFLHRGYTAEFQQGGLLLARFRGCPLTLRVAGGALPDDAVVEMGWYPLTETARRVRIAAAGAGGERDVPIGRAPCGAVWLRLASAHGADVAPPACAGADAQRRLVVESALATPVVACTLSATAGAAAPRRAES